MSMWITTVWHVIVDADSI